MDESSPEYLMGTGQGRAFAGITEPPAREVRGMASQTERDMTESPPRATADHSIAAPLKFPVFRRIWLASLLSNLGLLIQGVGAAWAMTQMASSADKVALVQTALMLPVMLISMPAGAIADLHDRGLGPRAALGLS